MVLEIEHFLRNTDFDSFWQFSTTFRYSQYSMISIKYVDFWPNYIILYPFLGNSATHIIILHYVDVTSGLSGQTGNEAELTFLSDLTDSKTSAIKCLFTVDRLLKLSITANCNFCGNIIKNEGKKLVFLIIKIMLNSIEIYFCTNYYFTE